MLKISTCVSIGFAGPPAQQLSIFWITSSSTSCHQTSPIFEVSRESNHRPALGKYDGFPATAKSEVSHLDVKSSCFKGEKSSSVISEPFKMGPDRLSRNVSNYHNALCNIAEELRPHLKFRRYSLGLHKKNVSYPKLNLWLMGHFSEASQEIQESFSTWIFWPLKMGPISCPKTSVRNYHYTLRNIPEERRSEKLSGLLKIFIKIYHRIVGKSRSRTLA
jgi:hypothetical protein